MKPVFDFLEQKTERDDEYYYKLYLLLMKELDFESLKFQNLIHTNHRKRKSSSNRTSSNI